MNEMTPRTPKRLPLRYIILLLLLTLSVSAVSLSRYSTTVAGSGSVSVARPVVEFAEPMSKSIVGMKPGDIETYDFVVTNTDVHDKSNQVTMEYTLIVVTPDEWPPMIRAVILDKDGVALPDPPVGKKMGFSSPEQHHYKLQLTWDASAYGSAISSNMGQTWGLQIHLDAVQVD